MASRDRNRNFDLGVAPFTSYAGQSGSIRPWRGGGSCRVTGRRQALAQEEATFAASLLCTQEKITSVTFFLFFSENKPASVQIVFLKAGGHLECAILMILLQ